MLPVFAQQGFAIPLANKGDALGCSWLTVLLVQCSADAARQLL